MSKKSLFYLVLCFSLSLPSFARGESKFIFPVNCTLGQNCWTVNYMDLDNGEAERDFRCEYKTYDGHQGTDFALKDRAQMKSGVNVLAAADGKVLRIRDGESDSIKTEAQYQAIREANLDCGNGILIEHAGGLKTFYCHLRAGTLLVKPGQRVKQGAAIAQIGQSGFSEFPHLHFAVIGGDNYIDPFTSQSAGGNCENAKISNTLWQTPLPYEPYSIFTAGFSDQIPDFKTILEGHTHPESLPAASDALLFWLGFYQARAGDTLNLRIIDPNGTDFVPPKTITIQQNRKRPTYQYLGRNTATSPIMPGRYQATATYQREGFEPYTIRRTIEIHE